MSMHFIVRFEPRPGCEEAFREVLRNVEGPSRAESGCLSFQVFESIREPTYFAIHSEWADEAAFEHHTTLPHTRRFIAAGEQLLTQEIRGLRLRSLPPGPSS